MATSRISATVLYPVAELGNAVACVGMSGGGVFTDPKGLSPKPWLEGHQTLCHGNCRDLRFMRVYGIDVGWLSRGWFRV